MLTAHERSQRTEAADAICAAALSTALDGADEPGIALVAVGGYGRKELAPFSDLDVVLVHADGRDVSELAPKVWYPLWDAAPKLDHSVRAESEVTSAAAADLRVALGLLDARHVAGEDVIAEACLAKQTAVEACEAVVDQAVQIHGGTGYMHGTEVERHYRDSRILPIGGGATEVLTDLAARLLGYAS